MVIWDMVLKGGIMMIPLFITSIVSLAVIIERAFALRKNRILIPDIINHISQMKNIDDTQSMLHHQKDLKGPLLNLIRVCLDHRDCSKEEIKEAVIDQGRQEARILERGLVILETIAGIAPLLGLLGTVLGMIRVFQVISEQGLVQTQSLSGGISEALITTVVGLSIAIPALIAYNYFNHKVEDLILEIEKHLTELIRKLKEWI